MNTSSPWPQLAACSSQSSTASPTLLERTATCSQQALDRFSGDPITPAYAAEIRQCGIQAIHAATLSPADIEPFVEVLCRRATTCHNGSYTDCRAQLADHFTAKLGRAIGSINAESRAALHACLQASVCSHDLGQRISACINPILSRLLWLPPDVTED